MDRIRTAIRSNAKAAIGLIIVFLLFIAILVLYWKDIMGLWPGKDTIGAEMAALEALHKDLEKEIREIHDTRLIRENFMRRGKDFWVPKKDGDIEGGIIRKLEDIAKSSGLKLQNIGNSRITKVNDDISSMEISIEAKSTMEEITKFISDLYRANPRFYWRKCVIRPFSPRDAKEIILSGTINVVSLNSENVAKVLMGESK